MAPAKIINRIPDFLIIGAGKSGTTSLDNYLKQHPQIFIPTVKEPNFFGYELTKIEDFKGDKQEIDHYHNSITQLDDYLDLFNEALPNQIKGETSNTYLYHESAPERIHHYNPEMKLVAIFRHPADRLYSRFLHLARENKLPTPNFEDCLNRETIWWKRNDLIKEGFYYKNLSRFYDLFPSSNIKIYLYEDLNINTNTVLRDLYSFLNVNSDFIADASIRYNQSGFVKNQFLNWLYGGNGFAQKMTKFILPKNTQTRIKENIYVQRIINSLKNKNLKRPKLDYKIREILTHEVYGDDIRKLQTLIGKNLSHWLS